MSAEINMRADTSKLKAGLKTATESVKRFGRFMQRKKCCYQLSRAFGNGRIQSAFKAFQRTSYVSPKYWMPPKRERDDANRT